MDIFEYNEVRWPTRALQQDEEEDAQAAAEQHLAPPDIKWTAGATDCTKPHLLVVAMSPASCALLIAAMGPTAQEVGQVATAAGQASTDADTQPRGGDKAAEGGAPAGLYVPLPGVLVCCCSSTVAPERAGAWARGVLGALQPQRLLLLGSLQAEQYRGEADASQELLAFILCSSPLRQQQQQPGAALGVPYLPSGSIVSGLPAALLTQAELAGLPAELLVVVEQVPSLVPETLGQLAKLVVGCLVSGVQPDAAKWAGSLAEGPVVDAARLRLQRTAYRPLAVYS